MLTEDDLAREFFDLRIARDGRANDLRPKRGGRGDWLCIRERPSLSPGGSKLALQSDRNSNYEIYVQTKKLEVATVPE